MSVAVSRQLGDFCVYETLGYSRFGSQSFQQIPLESTQRTSLTALERRFASRMSAVVPYMRSSGVARDLDVFSDSSNEIIFGWK